MACAAVAHPGPKTSPGCCIGASQSSCSECSAILPLASRKEDIAHHVPYGTNVFPSRS
jgi:hypothetical protein